MVPLPLAGIPWRLVGALGLVLALVAGGWWLRHAGYIAGEAAGAAKVQAAWDKDAAAREAATAALRAAAEAREAEQARIAREQETALREQIRVADDRGRELGRLLRAYQTRERERGVSEAAGPASGASPAGRESGDSGEARSAVDQALDEHLAACARDAERLDGWVTWWATVTAK